MTSPSETPLDLDAIRARARAAMRERVFRDRAWDTFTSQADVPALIAEVERLRALLASNHCAYLTMQGIDPDSEDVQRILDEPASASQQPATAPRTDDQAAQVLGDPETAEGAL